MTGDLLTEGTQEPLASCDAAFSCLLQLGGRSGGNKAVAVQCQNVVNGETLPISRLIELAADLGLKAEHVRLDWQRLQSLGFNHPLLVLLKNTNVILLTGGGRDGVSEVAAWDSGNPYGEILFVPREDFERASTGHALIITAPPSNGAETAPPSDFCWFTSAGIELLDKTSARGKNPKSLAEGRKEPGTHAKPPARQTDRATDPTLHAQLGIDLADVANELPPNPAEGASRAVAGRGLSPLVRFCLAAAGILAVAGSSTFLFRSSVTHPVATAIAFAKEVWAVAPPNGVQLTGDRIERVSSTVSSTVSAPISEAPPTTPGIAAFPTPSIAEPATPPAEPATHRAERTTFRVERTARRLAARPVPLSGDPDFAAAPAKSAVASEAAAPPATPAVASEAAAPPATPAVASEAAAPPATPAVASEAAAPPATPAVASEAAAPPATPAVASEAAAPPATPGPATAVPESQQASPLPAASPRLSAEEMAAFLSRGDTLLSVGDVASARLFYERVADAGGGLAAIRLGETFDQVFLDRARLRGVRGDPGAAFFWYRRARDLGAADAEVLLKALEAK